MSQSYEEVWIMQAQKLLSSPSLDAKAHPLPSSREQGGGSSRL
jgi:hypothetical protein